MVTEDTLYYVGRLLDSYSIGERDGEPPSALLTFIQARPGLMAHLVNLAHLMRPRTHAQFRLDYFTDPGTTPLEVQIDVPRPGGKSLRFDAGAEGAVLEGQHYLRRHGLTDVVNVFIYY